MGKGAAEINCPFFDMEIHAASYEAICYGVAHIWGAFYKVFPAQVWTLLPPWSMKPISSKE